MTQVFTTKGPKDFGSSTIDAEGQFVTYELTIHDG